MNSIPQKPCPKCGNSYPATNEYFHRDKLRNDGLFPYCKPCSRARALQYAAEHREQEKERARIWRENNPGYNQRYYKENPHMGIERARRKRADNPELVREYQSNWRRNNPGKLRAKGQRRRARKLNLTDNFTADDWNYALDYFNGRCAVCERPLIDLFGTHTAHADHWIPLSDENCPGTVPSNIVPLCGGLNGCNESKSAKPAIEWLIEKFGKRKARHIEKRIAMFFDTVRKEDRHRHRAPVRFE